MIETCVDGSNESARKGCNSLVGREWKGGPLENLGGGGSGSGSGSCALCVAEEDEKFWFWCWWWWARELQKQRREETRLWTPNGNHTKRREGEGFARRPVSTTILAKGVNNMQNRAREIFAEPWIA